MILCGASVRLKWKNEKNLVKKLFHSHALFNKSLQCGKMFSSTNADLIEVNSSDDEISQWNSSHPQHYAVNFPYTILDENFLRHLLNFTMARSETMRLNPNNSGSFKQNHDNDTVNYDECSLSHDTESAWFSTEFQATLHFMYITILVIAIFGNGIVCFIVCTSSRMQTVTNFFIANLALSDMLMAFFCIPFSFISLFVLQWVYSIRFIQWRKKWKIAWGVKGRKFVCTRFFAAFDMGNISRISSFSNVCVLKTSKMLFKTV